MHKNQTQIWDPGSQTFSCSNQETNEKDEASQTSITLAVSLMLHLDSVT